MIMLTNELARVARDVLRHQANATTRQTAVELMEADPAMQRLTLLRMVVGTPDDSGLNSLADDILGLDAIAEILE